MALGFGAQTLVKDTLAGLFIALEGQFDVGDVIDLQTEGGPVSGTVEGLTLRITSVRQYDGTLSIVPNGEIQVTSNKTRGWGRAIVDVRVALSEDPDRVRDVLEGLLHELAEEEPLQSWLREAPTVLGIVQLTDIAQVVRLVAQTTPGNRLDAERFLRERVTARITEQGIEGATGPRRASRRRRGPASAARPGGAGRPRRYAVSMSGLPFASVDELQAALAEHAYLADRGLATAIYLVALARQAAAARGRGRRRARPRSRRCSRSCSAAS